MPSLRDFCLYFVYAHTKTNVCFAAACFCLRATKKEASTFLCTKKKRIGASFDCILHKPCMSVNTLFEKIFKKSSLNCIGLILLLLFLFLGAVKRNRQYCKENAC